MVDEIWSSALAVWQNQLPSPVPSKIKRFEKHRQLFCDKLMQAESKVRLLNFISKPHRLPGCCVIFGHAATMNRTIPTFEDVGMDW